MRASSALLASILSAASAGPALASQFGSAAHLEPDAGRFAVSVKAGTQGVGVDGQFRFLKSVVLRAGTSILTYEREDDELSGIIYDSSLRLSQFNASVDYHPFRNGWYIAAGIVGGKKEVALNASPTTPVDIGGVLFTPTQIGLLNGKADYNGPNALLGLGYDRAVMRRDPGFGISALVGVEFSGAPEVTLISTGGTLSNDPTVIAALNQEVASVSEDLMEWYPIVELGLSYTF